MASTALQTSILDQSSSARGTARLVVARAGELEALDSFIQESATAAVALLIEGEAGIGKTPLHDAAIEEAARRGHHVVACRPGQSETELAYAGLGDLFSKGLDSVLLELPQPQRSALEA